MQRTRKLILMAALIAGAPAFAAPTPADFARDDAREFERRGQWDRACDAYAKLLAGNRNQPAVRERLQFCARRLHQVRRHQDPVFHAKILSLPTTQALTLYADVLSKLQSFYFERDKVPVQQLFQHGLDELRNALDDAVFLHEHLPTVEPMALVAFRDQLQFEWGSRVVADIGEARQAVRDVAREAQRCLGLVPTVAILEFACGACNALDEYTFFITPGQPLDDPTALSGELAAYGILLNWRERQLVIDRIVPGTWAATVGLQAGDRVTHVGKQALDRLTPEAIADLVRGDAVTVSELTVLAAGAIAGRLVALPGYVPSIPEAQMEREGIGYLRLANFQKTTPQELDSALLRLRSEGMRALVLDLRGNPGGSFAAAVQVADRFLPQGVIVSTLGQARGTSKVYTAQNPMAALDAPMVVLVDGDTASAAEVVAGAFKDHDRAVLIGTQTYGKGSIQCLLTLQAGSGLRLTLARFFSPRGQPFTGLGVTPHIVEERKDGLKDVPLELAFEQAARMLALK